MGDNITDSGVLDTSGGGTTTSETNDNNVVTFPVVNKKPPGPPVSGLRCGSGGQAESEDGSRVGALQADPSPPDPAVNLGAADDVANASAGMVRNLRQINNDSRTLLLSALQEVLLTMIAVGGPDWAFENARFATEALECTHYGDDSA